MGSKVYVVLFFSSNCVYYSVNYCDLRGIITYSYVPYDSIFLFLHCSFNMGSGSEKLQSRLPLNLDTWHGIEVIFRMNKVGFNLNEEQRPIFQQSKYTGSLDIDDIFFIGGTASASDATPK